MFAGPNGSGKSTLKALITKSQLGVYINADEIQQKLNQKGMLSLKAYGLTSSTHEWEYFQKQSSRIKKLDAGAIKTTINADNQILLANKTNVNAYLAALIADFIRAELLKMKRSFTFETVMSHISKVDLLIEARQRGYRTYLY